MVSVFFTPVFLKAVFAKYVLREFTSNLRGCRPGCKIRWMICQIFLGFDDDNALLMNDCLASLIFSSLIYIFLQIK